MVEFRLVNPTVRSGHTFSCCSQKWCRRVLQEPARAVGVRPDLQEGDSRHRRSPELQHGQFGIRLGCCRRLLPRQQRRKGFHDVDEEPRPQQHIRGQKVHLVVYHLFMSLMLIYKFGVSSWNGPKPEPVGPELNAGCTLHEPVAQKSLGPIF